MLAVSDHTPFPHVIKHVIQDDLFHDLSRHRGETHRPVVPGVLLAPLLVNGSDVTLPPVIRSAQECSGVLRSAVRSMEKKELRPCYLVWNTNLLVATLHCMDSLPFI